MEEYDLAVLGGGPGGYVAALRAAQLGARVALVEKQWIGGTCLNIGCIPTKALMSSAEAYGEARRGEEFGFSAGPVTPDWPRMVRRKQEIVDALVGGVERLLREQAVTVVRGVGQVRRPGEIEVSRDDGGAETVMARKLILATGSVPAELPVPGADLPGVITSTEALSLPEIPACIVIVGGGVIGVEFAALFHALGSRVIVIEMLPTLLAGQTEPTIAKRLLALFKRRGIQVLTDSPVQAIEPAEDDLLSVRFSGPKAGAVTCQRVLVATDRWANAEGLEALQVRREGRAVWVDEHLATNLPGVYAIGDLIPGPMLAHVAMVEGRVAAENALGGSRIDGLSLDAQRRFHHPRGGQRRPDRGPGPRAGRRGQGQPIPAERQRPRSDAGPAGGPGQAGVRGRVGPGARDAPDGAARHRPDRRRGAGGPGRRHSRRSGVDDPRPPDAARSGTGSGAGLVG